MGRRNRVVGHHYCIILQILVLVCCAIAPASEVDLGSAQRVARAEIQRHIGLHGGWGDAQTGSIEAAETVRIDGVAVAHHFSVRPSGHVLVAADDRFSPVLLYSPASAFDPSRVDDTASLEAWILPEIHGVLQGMDEAPTVTHRAVMADTAAAADVERISSAWQAYLAPGETTARALTETEDATVRLSDGLIVGPMMASRWGQGDLYNDQVPGIDGGCEHALTGCVATAFAQVMRYWQWPYNGKGGHSYQWLGQTISADFQTPYDWDLMPDRLSDSSALAAVDAVAHLLADVAVAVETDFGCGGSSSMRYGDEVLDRFFRYKPQMVRHSRSRYSAAGWFGLIQNELDAVPPRPMLFSIFTADWSGHEVVIDGYQIGPTDKVHINLGWSGAYNGYYDITHSFTAAYEWQADYQVLVTGIAPDNTPPLVAAGGDQVAAMGQAVTLSGTAVDPDGFALGQIRWVQRSGPLVLLTDAASLQTTFTAPQVAAGTDLAFELVVSDPHGAEASDTCTITVYPPLDRPVAMAGSDQTVSGGSEVNLTGSAMASEGHAIQTHAWVPPTDADQRVVRLSSENALSTSFIAPIVTEDTALIFTFQVSDTSGQDAEDRCTVTVRAEAPLQPESVPDAAESPVANDTGGRSSGGGPCFVGSLHP